MRLLVTRPEEDVACLSQALRQRGHEPILSPLLDIQLLPPTAAGIGDPPALIATSRNALRALALNAGLLDQARSKPVYVTGPGTGAFAANLGFADIREGSGTAAALPAFIRQTLGTQDAPLLYLSGEKVAFDMVTALEALSYRVTAVVCYRSVPATRLTPQALTALDDGTLDGVILMSPRTAEVFVEIASPPALAGKARQVYCYCLSHNVAAKLHRLYGEDFRARIRIAEQPDLAAILDAIDKEISAA